MFCICRFQGQQQEKNATQGEQDAQEEVNLGEEDPQTNGQALQTLPILPTEKEMEEKTSTTAIGQELNVLGKKVVADLKVPNVEMPLVATRQTRLD